MSPEELEVPQNGVPADIPVDAEPAHVHSDDCDHDGMHTEDPDPDLGRETQRMMNPMHSINWEPADGTILLKPDAPLSKHFDKFEAAVVRKHPYAWDQWSKIRKSVPRDMQNIVRSMWETYWHSPGMGPEPFRTVLALVRRKLGLPYHEEVLHKLQATDDKTVQDEQE